MVSCQCQSVTLGNSLQCNVKSFSFKVRTFEIFFCLAPTPGQLPANEVGIGQIFDRVIMHRAQTFVGQLFGTSSRQVESTAAKKSKLLTRPYPKWLVVSEEVQRALDKNSAVVALESTIISHGMPYPQNYETAKQVEEVARSNGATPATIAILDGVVHVGLTDESLKKLAVCNKPKIIFTPTCKHNH